MASGYLDTGQLNHRYSSTRYPNVWHIHPVIVVDSLYYENSRDSNQSPTVHWHFVLTLRKPTNDNFNGSTGYNVEFVANGVGNTKKVNRYINTYTFEVWFDTNWASNDNQTINVGMHCFGNASGTGCDYGCWDDNLPYSCAVPYYQTDIAPTNVSFGKVFTSNNTGGTQAGNISEKPDMQVWFDWWGQSSGYPSYNEIDFFNIDINTIYDAGGAGSVALTQHYTQNTRLSLMTLCKTYGIKVGGTLYFWVNTCTKGGSWLGRVYLGSVTIIKSGMILYKDSNGTRRECTLGYNKNSSAGKNKARYILVKDSNGTKRLIDVFTTLYE